MTKASSVLGIKQGKSSWPAALIGMVVIKAILSLAVKPGSFVVSYSGISYFLLLVLATGFAIRNAIRNALGGRLFWALLGVAFALWGANQGLQLYHQLGLREEVPGNSIADPLLFMHVGALMAALATLPHRTAPDRSPYASMLNALLVIFFWTLLYGYVVFPYQYFYSSPPPFTYDLRFDVLYLGENLALISAVALLFARAKNSWKSIYFHILGASALYALSSAIANLATDYLGGYANGKLYGLGLTASVCWFLWISLCASRVPRPEVKVTSFEGGQSSKASVWAMLAVVTFSIPVVWELLKRDESDGLRSLRVVFAVAMIVCLACAAYIREYMAKRELASHFGAANDRLHLAMQAGTAAVWELDLKRGRGVLFGDLRTIFGIPSEVSTYNANELIRYIHPDDREEFSEAFADARQYHRLFERECRIVRADGAVRWLEARGKFYYARHGSPERMIGVSLDITDRKQAEEALSGMTRKLIEAQEQERARIGRELHDDINQRLAMLAVELDQLQDDPSDLPSRVKELRKAMAEISDDVQGLSHELHSSKLAYLGVVAGIRSWCNEFGERQKMEIQFSSDVRSALPHEIGLTLLRVLQEALHNVIKHSGVKKASVELQEDSSDIHLVVSDEGRGFETEAALRGEGLGLTSMRERVRLINGTISIESKPKGGTTINVRVPIGLEQASERKAV
jgi:signal transduction histidine kinase